MRTDPFFACSWGYWYFLFVRSSSTPPPLYILRLKSKEPYRSMILAISLVEERRRLYEQLRRDPDYTDVAFDPKTGGLKATHVRHNFEMIGGTGERRAQEIGFRIGNAVLLLEEDQTIHGVKSVDGLWNGEKMEIATTLTGSSNSILRVLSHCASKDGSRVAVIVIMKNASEEVMYKAAGRFSGLKASNPKQWKELSRIVFVDAEKAQMISVVPQ